MEILVESVKARIYVSNKRSNIFYKNQNSYKLAIANERWNFQIGRIF